MILSCIKPTTVADKDCAGIVGGDGVVDECGVCNGPGVTGCDNICGSSTKLDCNGECGGLEKPQWFCENFTTEVWIDSINYTISDSDTLFNILDSIIVSEDSIEYIYNWDYMYGIDTIYSIYGSELFGIDTILNILSRVNICSSEITPGNCNPGTDACNFVNCNNYPEYQNSVIDCDGNLPIQGSECSNGICVNFNSYVGDGSCDYFGVGGNKTVCKEFNFDGGDCNLIDCTSNVRWSDDVCAVFINDGQSCIEGDNSWLGDGGCEEGDNDMKVNFNCEDWGYDCNDCENDKYDGTIATDPNCVCLQTQLEDGCTPTYPSPSDK